jgi:hypothetical protein
LSEVLTVADVDHEVLSEFLGRFDLDLIVQSTDDVIAGSFWGDAEAGIVGHSVFVRPDTPVHSLLHESSHVICMDGDRRSRLDRDAGGDDLEESAVCYLQIVLADHIVGVGRERIMADMDAWGYSFRLGSTRAWFENDADDAQNFLLNHNLIDSSGEPTFFLRP